MSPEDRAEKLVAAWNYETGAVTDHQAYCKLIDRISEAFRAAEQNAREKCAKLAETRVSERGWHPSARNAGIIIAAEIRARRST